VLINELIKDQLYKFKYSRFKNFPPTWIPK